MDETTSDRVIRLEREIQQLERALRELKDWAGLPVDDNSGNEKQQDEFDATVAAVTGWPEDFSGVAG